MRFEKLSLSTSMLLLAAGVLTIYNQPSSGYQLSIYASTPTLYWLGVLGAASLSIVSGVITDSKAARNSNILIGSVAIVIFSITPYLKQYAFYGIYDPWNHLGTARDIQNGEWAIHDVLYPSMHHLIVELSHILGISLEHAMLMLPGVFVTLYIAGMLFFASRIEIERQKFMIVAGSSFLLLWLVAIRVPQLLPSPTILGIVFWPLILGLFVWQVRTNDNRISVLIMLLLGISTFVHPQHAVAFLAVGGVFWLLISIPSLRSFYSNTPAQNVGQKGLIGSLLAVSPLVAFWTVNSGGFSWSVKELTLGLIFGAEVRKGGENQVEYLDYIGTSMTELFLRAFGVKAMVAVIVSVSVLLIPLYIAHERDPPIQPILFPFGVAFIPVLVMMAMYFAIQDLGQAFRYLGVVYVFGTIAFASTLSNIDVKLSALTTRRLSAIAISLLLIVMLVISAGTAYRQPPVYQANEQISPSMMDGYELTLQYAPGPYMGTLIAPNKPRTGILGKTVSGRGENGYPPPDRVKPRLKDGEQTWVTPFHFANQSLPQRLTNTTYLSVTEYPRQSHLELYNELHFTANDFEWLNQSKCMNKVVSTGDYELYQVKPEHRC